MALFFVRALDHGFAAGARIYFFLPARRIPLRLTCAF
jgi:hypothetical protein